jgi:pimeloyl-ACP methyl ester carboxylesterase
MNHDTTHVLIHSPLVGTLTWTLVAAEMRQRGLRVIMPAPVDVRDSRQPFWKQHAESVAHALAEIPTDVSVTLIGHSGAGPLLPVIRRSIPNPVHAYVFVDAGLPHDNATRLDLMKAEDADWAAEFQNYLEGGGRFPNWTSQDLSEILPDENLRNQLAADLRPRGMDFFTEPIPVFVEGWPDAPCIYIQFSEPYRMPAIQAQKAGWSTYQLEAGHFHMLVDPPAVTELILNAINKIVPTFHE